VPDYTEIRRLRYDAGYTVKELADIVKVSPAAIYKYETNRVKRPHPGAARRLVDFFGVPLATLLSPETETPPTPRSAGGAE
jgi:transcriptional regulator with XRE-family HTH domain